MEGTMERHGRNACNIKRIHIFLVQDNQISWITIGRYKYSVACTKYMYQVSLIADYQKRLTLSSFEAF